jgi:hypothetical protein
LRIEKVANFIKNTYSKKANIKTARILIRKVEHAAQRYNSKHNKYPDSLDVLKEPTVESGVPLLESDTIDPWGNEVRYEKRGGKPPRITSAGPDGEFDTDDDFMNLDAKPKKKGETSSSRRNIQKTTCIMNMKQLLTGAESWLAKYPDRVPTLTDLCGPEKYLKKELTCPKNGSHYRIIRLNNRTIDIRCGSGDPNHVLP